MIPLPRASVLAGVMIIGVALGMMGALVLAAGSTAAVGITAPVRPDVAIGLVLGVPGAIGMLMVVLSSRRWVTAVGAMILAVGPGWFGALTAMQVASGV